ncbi:MAG: rhodanese-like domain-containing protein, partial [Rhodopila sp.]
MFIKKGYKQLLAEANAEIETLPVETAIGLYGGAGVVFVDLRDPREMEREGKMPGAFACTRGMLEFWIDP